MHILFSEPKYVCDSDHMKQITTSNSRHEVKYDIKQDTLFSIISKNNSDLFYILFSFDNLRQLDISRLQKSMTTVGKRKRKEISSSFLQG